MTQTEQTLSVLALQWTDRPVGANQSPRRFLDFVVDGRPLFERLGKERDFITALLRTPSDWYEVTLDELQLRAEPELIEGRQALYVCPECADLGCGAISAVVSRRGDSIVWEDFAYYNTFNIVGDRVATEPLIRRDGYEDVGPFVFEFAAYVNTLQAARLLLKDSPLHT